MSLYRNPNDLIEIDGKEYMEADVFKEIIDDIEARVSIAYESLKRGLKWAGDAYDEIEGLAKDLY